MEQGESLPAPSHLGVPAISMKLSLFGRVEGRVAHSSLSRFWKDRVALDITGHPVSRRFCETWESHCLTLMCRADTPVRRL